MGQSYALSSAPTPPLQLVHEFLIYITFFCQMTLFNGLRFSYVDLTSVSLMIPCFSPIHVPQNLHSISTPPFPSQFFPYLDTFVTPASLLTSPAHPPPIVSFTVPCSMCVASPHVESKLLEGTIFLLPLLYIFETQYLAGNTVGLHC